MSVQHSEDITLPEMRKQLTEKIVKVSGRGGGEGGREWEWVRVGESG